MAAIKIVGYLEKKGKSRAKERVTQEKWLQALLEAMGQSVPSPEKMNHFRYSMDDLSPPIGKKSIARQNTLPHNYKNKVNRRNSLMSKIKRMGGKPYLGSADAINTSDSKVPMRNTTINEMKANEKECCENNNKVRLGSSDKSDIVRNGLIANVKVIDSIVINNEMYITTEEIDKKKKNTDKNKGKYQSKIEKNTFDADTNKEIILQNELYATVNKSEETINKGSKSKQTLDSGSSEDSVFLDKENYGTIKSKDAEIDYQRISDTEIDNVQYMSHTSPRYKLDNNEEKSQRGETLNDHYATIEKAAEKTETNYPNNCEEELEYYCTYEDIKKDKEHEHLYNELDPALPPRKNRKSSESESKSTDSGGKQSKSKKLSFMKFARRFTKSSTENKESKQKTKSFFAKVLKKKKIDPDEDSVYMYSDINIVTTENDGKSKEELVEYEELLEIKPKKTKKCGILGNTLAELQNKLEERQTQVEEITPDLALGKETIYLEKTRAKSPTPAHRLKSENHHFIPPNLPPRKGPNKRACSPHHDVPKNNSPVAMKVSQIDYNIDDILDDLKKLKTTMICENSSPEELSVKQLIRKFDKIKKKDENQKTNDNVEEEVHLRIKSDVKYNTENSEIVINRHSDELNKLLEELTKVTCAPLMTPGATCSLVQMKSDGLTDEEFLALHPIRRRRHSEPDYDVPRPHRSLQILPRSPTKEEDKNDIAISATRFFGPILPHENEKVIHNSMPYRSMTPDSLEPFNSFINGIKSQRNTEMNTTYIIEKTSDIIEDKMDIESYISSSKTKINDETYVVENKQITELKQKSTENFLDSLESFIELSTVF